MRRREANSDLGQSEAITAMVKAGVPTGTAQRMFDDSVDMRVGTLQASAAKIGMNWQLLVQRSALTPTPPAQPRDIGLDEALPVVLGRLPGRDAYTADQVLTAIKAAMGQQPPLERIERDLLRLLSEPATAATAPAKRQA